MNSFSLMIFQDVDTITHLYYNLMVVMNYPLATLHAVFWFSPDAVYFFELNRVYEPTRIRAILGTVLTWFVVATVLDITRRNN